MKYKPPPRIDKGACLSFSFRLLFPQRLMSHACRLFLAPSPASFLVITSPSCPSQTFSFPTGLIPQTLRPSNVFILLNGWICLRGVLD